MTDDVYKAFERGSEVAAVFLDISSAFDRVWHKGLPYKMKKRVLSIKCWFGLRTTYLHVLKRLSLLDSHPSFWGQTHGFLRAQY